MLDIDSQNYKKEDVYGLYQVRRTHPVYGEEKLLYTGKTELQTFGVL